MRTAAGLAVLAAGSILTFAVYAHVPGINLHIAGVILMLAGLAGMVPPRRAAGWLYRLAHHGAMPPDNDGTPGPLADPDDGDLYSSYLLQDPAVLAAEVLRSARDN